MRSRTQEVTTEERPHRSASLRRAGLVVVVLQILLIALSLRGFDLQFGRAAEFDGLRRRQTRATETVLPCRGRIVTRDGLVVACDAVSWLVALDPVAAGKGGLDRALGEFPYEVVNLRSSVESLRREAFEQLRSGRRYLVLGDVQKASALAHLETWLRGWRHNSGLEQRCFRVQRLHERRYPQGTLAAQLVGATGWDGSGIWGLERTWNRVLEGIPGVRCVHLAGRRRLAGDRAEDVPPIDGRSLQLTIEFRVQELLERELERARSEHSAQRAIGIVLDPRDGAVLAMASSPLLDRAELRGVGGAEYQRILRERGALACRWLYEPGSTIKGLVYAESLCRGIDDRQQVSDGSRTWKVPTIHRVIKDASHHGPLDIRGAVIHSSNIGMAKVGLLLGKDGLRECLNRFHLTRRTGIELPEEEGYTTPYGRWNDYTLTSLGFGYEIMVTPLQIARAYCSLVNGGFEVTPYLVARLGGDGERSADGVGPQPRRRILPASVAARVREVLHRAAAEGTGKNLHGEPIHMAGKSGTTVKNGKGGYAEGRYVSSFVGIAPYESPRFLVMIVVDEPQGKHFGAQVAGPVVRRILGALLGEEGNLFQDRLEGVLEPSGRPSMIPQSLDGEDSRWGGSRTR